MAISLALVQKLLRPGLNSLFGSMYNRQQEAKMSIIGRLWREVWQHEQDRKERAADAEYGQAIINAQNWCNTQKELPTPLQKMAEQRGATFGEPLTSAAHPVNFGGQSYSSAVLSPYGNSLAGQMTNQISAATAGLYRQLQNTNQSLQGHNLQVPPYANATIQGSNILGQGTQMGGGKGQTGTPVRHLGHYSLDTLFMALRGVEELAIAERRRGHAYDDQAVKLLDMRNFNGKTVNMLSLCSFCTSNCYPAHELIELLHQHGITAVVQE